jgi:hypothetical protein
MLLYFGVLEEYAIWSPYKVALVFSFTRVAVYRVSYNFLFWIDC